MNITIKDLEFYNTVEIGQLQKDDKFIYYGDRIGIILDINEESDLVKVIEFNYNGKIEMGIFDKSYLVIPATFDLTVSNIDSIELEEMLSERKRLKKNQKDSRPELTFV